MDQPDRITILEQWMKSLGKAPTVSGSSFVVEARSLVLLVEMN